MASLFIYQKSMILLAQHVKCNYFSCFIAHYPLLEYGKIHISEFKISLWLTNLLNKNLKVFNKRIMYAEEKIC